jgi:hypothetical protein
MRRRVTKTMTRLICPRCLGGAVQVVNTDDP